ncbi:hypothetical protein Sjap_019854 [Stephania japonica]|uniref:Phospholipase D n=1 Tax=Stephania japonica TaxID=461633 RepID=A0AAP0HZX2_9MAGN
MEAKNKFFHGTLEATIFHATPYKPHFPFNCIPVGEKASYVTIKIDQKKVAETSHKFDRLWNETFRVLCAHASTSTITIMLRTKWSILGKIHVPAIHLMNEASLMDGFFPLLTEKGKPNPELKLRFILWFRNADGEHSWESVLSHGNFLGLKGSSFPLRANCDVVLYQDAHHHSTFHPPSYKFGRRPRKLWEDVYKALDGAKHLIYIAGWSFNPNMVLVRDPRTEMLRARGVKLGELLKRKAEEGVAVRVMLWDDETSLPIIKNKGVMRTHDEDAFDYFKHTKVVCRLCPRLHHKFPTLFAHHQKTITVDTEVQFPSSSADRKKSSYSSRREIMSFIGGLDLCDGRYDTEEHSLFQTLNTEAHAQDFYQTSISGASLQSGGPREPWHDAHACIKGDAAWDIMKNFEQRWTKQCNPLRLVNTSAVPNLIQPSYTQHLEDSQQRDWKVQVFRSIDHVTVSNLPDKISKECSIHEAYVEAIRRAERFIYIENQYFIGGCHMWEQDRHCGCKNLIPLEIALKLVSKIKAGERFAAYIVIPMWPEGVSDSEPVQDILHWTRQTMSMMYMLIGDAIRESGKDAHPRDFLNFFCLANREKAIEGELISPHSPQHGSQYWKAQKHRRFMIYVHSKLMIVDDRYILIGSANVNQRSMDGRRDTEIAVGCYQPKYAGNKVNYSDIHAYRMSLWFEHTRRHDKAFLQPHSLDCVKMICSIGQKMWDTFSGEKIVDMGGVHLVNYPIKVSSDGSVEDLPTCGGVFPDTAAHIKGKRSRFLPPRVTT